MIYRWKLSSKCIVKLLSCSFASDSIPTRKVIILQIYVAMKGMHWYTLLPAASEYIIEHNWTKCYSTLDQFNWFVCFLYIALYLVLVEFGIYWVHKEVHDIKFLYNHFYVFYHLYNKQNKLSPFARKLSYVFNLNSRMLYHCWLI